LGLSVNRFAIPAVILSAAILLSGAAQAMEIQQYDKMALQDQNDYAIALIVGSQRVLIDAGKGALAAQIQKLFKETLPGEQIPLGLVEFESNLDRARVADAERASQDPTAHRLQVEDAMLVTLQKNNIPLSREFVQGFRAINVGFRPKLPRQH
jgi:hypothetical protein